MQKWRRIPRSGDDIIADLCKADQCNNIGYKSAHRIDRESIIIWNSLITIFQIYDYIHSVAITYIIISDRTPKQLKNSQ